MICNIFWYVFCKYWDKISVDFKLIYIVVSVVEVRLCYEEFVEKWGKFYLVIIWLWDSVWEEFILFLDYDVEIW